MDHAMANQQSFELKLDFISKKGTKKVVRTHGRVEMEAGKPSRVYGAIQDITEAHQVQTKLSNIKERFEAIYNRAPLPISMLNLEGKMLGMNPAFEKIIGYSLDEIPDLETWYDIAYKTPGAIDIALSNWKQIRDGAESGTTEFEPIVRDIRCKDGNDRKIEWHFARSEDFLIIVFIDISDATKAQRALTVSEVMYRNLYNLAPIMMDSLDKNARIIHVNEFWLQNLGYTREEVIDKPIYEFIHPEDRRKSRLAFNRFLVTHDLEDFRFRFIKESGDVMDTLVNAIAEFDPSDQFANTISVYKDITKQVKAEKELIGANERYSKLIDNIPGMIFRAKYDRLRSLEFLSKKSLEFIGKEASELLAEGYNLNNLIAEEDVSEVSKAIQFGLDTQQTYAVTYKLTEEISPNKWVLESGNLVEGMGSERFIEGSIFDITDRISLEEKIAATTMETEDRERTRISKEIHDGLQQTLSLSAMMFDNMNQSTALDQDSKKQLQEGINHLNRAMEECREIAHRLMPVSITDFGLLLSIENLVRDMNNSGSIEVSFITNMTDSNRLKLTTETSLFRIVQEALNNINKHASAKACSIQLLKIGEKIQLTIEDDGIGFDPKGELRDVAKLGLKNMENRATSMSGQFIMESKLNGGSLIICRIPLQRHQLQN
jgi:PAS domain S-box-containing protein